MRVLLDCRMASWGGVGRYTTGLARALACREDLELIQIAAAGETPPVADGGAASAASDSARPATTLVAQKHPFTLAGAREFGRLVAGAKPDVVHCAHFPTPSPVPHPLVVTMHDVAPLRVPGLMGSALKRAVYRWWVSRALRGADRVIVDATFTIAEIEAVFSATGERMRVVPLGVDDFASGPAHQAVPANSAPWPLAGRPHLLSMGSTRLHKDLPTLLRAFAAVAPQHPELVLLLAGAETPGYLERELAGAPESVRERVAFTGPVSDDGLRELMATCELFVFPSRYEGFGLPPLEAMAFGAPVISADAASLPEVVGDAGVLFAPGDDAGLASAIEELLGDRTRREALAQAGRERAAGFTWERTAEATVAVYREAISAAPGGAR